MGGPNPCDPCSVDAYGSTASLTTRLPACHLPQSALHHRCFGRCPVSRRFKITSQCALRMWSLRSLRCLTKAAVHPIRRRLHGTVPSYLADELQCPTEFEARRRLRATSSSSLIVRRTRLSTVGDRAIPVAAVRTWNSLPLNIRHVRAFHLPVFRGRLKAFLFWAFLSMIRYLNFCSACAVTVAIFGHLDRSFYLFTY